MKYSTIIALLLSTTSALRLYDNPNQTTTATNVTDKPTTTPKSPSTPIVALAHEDDDDEKAKEVTPDPIKEKEDDKNLKGVNPTTTEVKKEETPVKERAIRVMKDQPMRRAETATAVSPVHKVYKIQEPVHQIRQAKQKVYKIREPVKERAVRVKKDQPMRSAETATAVSPVQKVYKIQEPVREMKRAVREPIRQKIGGSGSANPNIRVRIPRKQKVLTPAMI